MTKPDDRQRILTETRNLKKFKLSDRSATHDQRHSMMEQKEQQNDNRDWHAK